MGNGTELSWPMLRDSRDKAPGLRRRRRPGHPRRLHVGQNGISERTDGEARWSRATTSRSSGFEPAIGSLDTADRRPNLRTARPRRCSATTTGRRRFAGRRASLGQAIPNQRPPVHRDWRRGPRASTASSSGSRADVFVPVTMQPQLGPGRLKIENRRFRWVQVYARLRAGRQRRAGAGRPAAALQRDPADGGAGDRRSPRASAETRRRSSCKARSARRRRARRASRSLRRAAGRRRCGS